MWIDPGEKYQPGSKSDGSDAVQGYVGFPSMSMRAFLLTYPSMNILIISYLIQYPWIYDFLIVQQGRRINLLQRYSQQWKTFLIATKIFTVLMYLVFVFGFPIKSDEEKGSLFQLYKTLLVFEIISALLMLC